MLTTVLFDLDGTLLPMVQEEFVQAYLGRLARWAAPLGYAPKTLIDAVWKGTAAMVRNDGGRTNREAFWDCFAERFGQDVRAHERLFDEFYRTDFWNARDACGFAPEAGELIALLKERGIRRILATNPIFPSAATHARIAWAGLSPEDFSYITTYENAIHCKPNPAYYADILAQTGLKPEECLMVGNDVGEDAVAAELGIAVFLLTPCLIDTAGRGCGALPHGDFSALKAFLLERLGE